MNIKYFDWAQKYRPSTVEECILPKGIKDIFLGILKENNIPNMILTGTPGVGKTSVAIALLEELGFDYIKINSSLKTGIDVVRSEIMDFATAVSFNDGRKYIILDEADGLSREAQGSLKAFIEEYGSNAGFIITCNHPERLDSAIFSRFALIDFSLSKEPPFSLGKQFLDRACEILTLENVEFDQKSVAFIIKKFYPDFRHVLNELQTYSLKNKEIDSGILVQSNGDDLEELILLLKSKNWNKMRKWIGENNHVVNNFNSFAKHLLNSIKDKLQPSCLPSYIILYNEYDYKQAFVMDKEINVVAFLTQIMSEMVWKD